MVELFVTVAAFMVGMLVGMVALEGAKEYARSHPKPKQPKFCSECRTELIQNNEVTGFGPFDGVPSVKMWAECPKLPKATGTTVVNISHLRDVAPGHNLWMYDPAEREWWRSR